MGTHILTALAAAAAAAAVVLYAILGGFLDRCWFNTAHRNAAELGRDIGAHYIK